MRHEEDVVADARLAAAFSAADEVARVGDAWDALARHGGRLDEDARLADAGDFLERLTRGADAREDRFESDIT